MGLPLGIGSPERCISFPVSFSHRSVGSSILASLSEAGGNDPRKPASKPLPPRFANFHEPSTETHPTPTPNAKSKPIHTNSKTILMSLKINNLAKPIQHPPSTNLVPQFQIGTRPYPFGNPPLNFVLEPLS